MRDRRLCQLILTIEHYEGAQDSTDLCARLSIDPSQMRRVRRAIRDNSLTFETLCGTIVAGHKSHERDNSPESETIVPEKRDICPASRTCAPAQKESSSKIVITKPSSDEEGGVGETCEGPQEFCLQQAAEDLAFKLSGELGTPDVLTAEKILKTQIQHYGLDQVRAGLTDLDVSMIANRRSHCSVSQFNGFVRRAGVAPAKRCGTADVGQNWIGTPGNRIPKGFTPEEWAIVSAAR